MSLEDRNIMIPLKCRPLVCLSLVLMIACASAPTTTDREPRTRTVDPTADPMPPLLSASAIALRLSLDDPDLADHSLALIASALDTLLTVSPDAASDNWPTSTTSAQLLQALRLPFGAPDDLPSLDTQRPSHIALTPQGHPGFLNALQISRVIPIETYPHWFHVRQLIPAQQGQADALVDEVESQLESASFDAFRWRTRVHQDLVVLDYQIPLATGVYDDLESLGGRIESLDLGLHRLNSPARAHFARSQSPATAYIDYRRVGQLLAMHNAASQFTQFSDSIRDWRPLRLPLMSAWIRANHTTIDIFQSFTDDRVAFGEVSIAMDRSEADLQWGVVTTRTEHGLDQQDPNSDSTHHCQSSNQQPSSPLWNLMPALSDPCAFDAIISTLFDTAKPTLNRRDSPRGRYAILNSRQDGHIAVDDPPLPEVSIFVDPLPSCVLDVRRFSLQSLGEIQRQATTSTPSILDRRIVSTLERARRCEQHHPQLPRLSTVMSRHLWQMGLHSEQEGRHVEARLFFDEACELGDPLTCRYRDRLERTLTTEVPTIAPKRGLTQAPLVFAGFVQSYITVDELDRLSVGDRFAGTLQEISDPSRDTVLRELLEQTSTPTPLGLVAADPALFEQARHTVALAARPDFEASELLRPFATQSLTSPLTIHPLVEIEAVENRRFALSSIQIHRATDENRVPPNSGPQIEVHLGQDGIDIVHDDAPLPPVEGCPRNGPTLCSRQSVETVEGLPLAEFYAQMPRVTDWRQGRGEIALILDTDISWELLAELAILLQNQGHPQWEGPAPRQMLGLTSRIGTPYSHVTVILADGESR